MHPNEVKFVHADVMEQRSQEAELHAIETDVKKSVSLQALRPRPSGAGWLMMPQQ